MTNCYPFFLVTLQTVTPFLRLYKLLPLFCDFTNCHPFSVTLQTVTRPTVTKPDVSRRTIPELLGWKLVSTEADQHHLHVIGGGMMLMLGPRGSRPYDCCPPKTGQTCG